MKDNKNIIDRKSRGGSPLLFWLLAVILLAGLVTGIVFLVLHLIKKNEGKAGNWTEAQIKEKADSFAGSVSSLPVIGDSLSPDDIAKAVTCLAKEASRLYAFDEDCFKDSSCNIDTGVTDRCIGGVRGSWTPGLKAALIKYFPTTVPSETALCMADVLSRNYGFSDLLRRVTIHLSSSALSPLSQIGLTGLTDLTGLTGQTGLTGLYGTSGFLPPDMTQIVTASCPASTSSLRSA